MAGYSGTPLIKKLGIKEGFSIALIEAPSDVTQQLGISPKKSNGNPPLDYLHRWRMTIARSALRHSEAPLIDIASRIGYQSDTAFSIAFKRASGKSPGRFRAQSRVEKG